MKRCRTCGVEKPLAEFGAAPRNRDRLEHRCRECERTRQRAAYHRSPDVRAKAAARQRTDAGRAYAREYRRQHPTETAAAFQKCAHTPRARAQALERTRAYARTSPEKRKAQEAVANALRTGALVRPAACGRCSEPARRAADGRSLLHAHHWSYEPQHRLDVDWLCRSCHAIEHRGPRSIDITDDIERAIAELA